VGESGTCGGRGAAMRMRSLLFVIISKPMALHEDDEFMYIFSYIRIP